MNHEPVDQALSHYGRVPYQGVADPETQVRGLHALAVFHGLTPAHPARCRVLELGCASGRNLLPQAAEFPGSRFVGIDAAAPQVAAAQSVATAAGLANVQLHPARIEDLDASWGRFDYLLCPGVFSWVPPEIQERIFRICREHLSPDGIAVITHNVLPGWHFQNVARDLMRCHVAPLASPNEQIAAARQILEFAAEHCPDTSLQGQVFRRERDYLRTVQDEYLYHDYLVDENRPLYFQQFMQRAERHELQLVCDANLAKQSGSFMPPAVQQVLANTPLLERCQLLDFLRNESFRKTLLAHRDQPLDRGGRAEALRGFHLILVAVPKPAEFDHQTAQAVELHFPAGRLTTRDPLGKAALRELIQRRPQPIALEELYRIAVDSLPPSAATDQDRGEAGLLKLAGAMAGALHAGLIKVFLDPPRFCREVTDRPRTPSPNCVWAARGELAVNQLHENIRLTKRQSFVLSQLDGSRTQTALAESLARAISEGRFEPLADEPPAEQQLTTILSDLAHLALLIG